MSRVETTNPDEDWKRRARTPDRVEGRGTTDDFMRKSINHKKEEIKARISKLQEKFSSPSKS